MSETQITRVLMLHGEAIYFGGAEVLLARLAQLGLGPAMKLTVARVAGGRLARALPADIPVLDLPANQPFSVGGLRRQLAVLCQAEFDVMHAWGVRAWEVAVLAGTLAGRPVVGTLHDHPSANYLTPARRRLMRLMAHFGLGRVTVVSEALRTACSAAGWPEHKISVVCNGIGTRPAPARVLVRSPMRFGFLGSLTAVKGLPDLLTAAAKLSRLAQTDWELHIAGRTQTEAEASDLRRWQEPFRAAAWWQKVHWRGWVEPTEFLAGIDVLVFPSQGFETFGLAPAEAALATVPTVGACTGAVPEVVADGATGWLFPPGDTEAMAEILARLLKTPDLVTSFGAAARVRVLQNFPESKMVAGYRTILCDLVRDAHLNR